MKPAVAQRRRFRSLASRLVLLGLLQLVLLAGTAVIIFIAEGPHEPGRPEEHVLPPLIHRLEMLADDPDGLQRAVDDLKRDRIEVSLYDSQKRLLASNVDPPLAVPDRRFRHGPPPPSPMADDDGPPPPGPTGPPGDERVHPPRDPHDRDRDRFGGPPFGGKPHRMVLRLRIHDDLGYLIARGVHGEPPGFTGPLLVLVCGFAILVFGALLTARWIVRPVERLSRTARALGSGDLSARSRLERSDEIGELGHRFDEMADRIMGLLVTEKELLANVAHELRTPLTRIGVALDLASEGDAEAARASLAEIAVDVSELETIVDDILTAMRFEIAGTAQLPLRRAVVAPKEIAEATAERMRARHASRRLDVAIAADLPVIDVDPVLFRRVIDNLVENAHKYTPDLDAPITLTVGRDPKTSGVFFDVRDRGIGIPAEDLPRVFTAFFRGDRSRSRETGGVGLGLTLAKRIVEAHGGAIAIESTPGDGTLVRVTIPAAA